MNKNTLVPETLLCDVYRLIHYLEDELIPDNARRLCEAIEFEIVDKLKRREIHKAFTAYKTTPPGPEREKLRLEYAKLAEIHRSFISNREIPYSSFDS